jgi:hypothetical protein
VPHLRDGLIVDKVGHFRGSEIFLIVKPHTKLSTVSATLTMREIPDGLSIHITEPRRPWRILLTLAVGVAFAVMFHYAKGDSYLVRIFFFGIAAVSIVREIISLSRGTEVELRITNLEFISTGHAPSGYNSSSIPRADIYWMEFRKAIGGGDDREQPSGLYVEHHGILRNPTTCVLPHIDKAQTEQVIEAIYRRFPDTSTLAPSTNTDPYLISLNLNQRR